MTIQQYSKQEYADKIWTAVKAYNYPAVTYDFEWEEAFDNDPDRQKDHCKCKNGGHEAHRECMREVEKKIKTQLFSGDILIVKDGLSNVLYWGFARIGYGWNRVQTFRDEITDDQLIRFVTVVHDLTDSDSGLAAIRGRVNNKIDNMAQFTQMSFVSKARMFLDPDNYPVLDMKLATNLRSFHLFGRLMIRTSIPITRANEHIYQEWAELCRSIAGAVNSYPSSPRRDLRAVDVERAIFQLADSDPNEAIRLLQGPKD